MDAPAGYRWGASVTGLLMVIFSLAGCVSSWAQIGKTPDQVLNRYGRCLRSSTADNGMVYMLFSKSRFKILVHFYKNKVDEITYRKDTDITDEEMKALMEDNAPGQWLGSGWPTYSWHNAAAVSARYSFEHHLLMIMTDAALERENKGGKDTLSGSDFELNR